MARRARAALKGAGERLTPDLRDSRRVLSAVSDYLKTKNLWNDPTTGRFIRRGRSEGKSRLIHTLITDRSAAVARLKASPNRQSRVRLRSSERALVDLNGGSLDVTAEYVDDQTVVATIAGRRYEVSWDKIDVSWRPASATSATRFTRPAIADASVPVETGWDADRPSRPDRWISATTARYGEWTLDDLVDDANTDELVNTIAQMVQDGAFPPYRLEQALKRDDLADHYVTDGQLDMLAAALVPEYPNLPVAEQALVDEAIGEAVAVASVAGLFRRDVTFGSDVRSVRDTPVGDNFDAAAAIQYLDFTLRVSDEATTTAKIPQAESMQAINASPLMRQMVDLLGGPVLTSVDGPDGLGGVATTVLTDGPTPANTFIGYGSIGPGTTFSGRSVPRVDHMLANSVAHGVLDASFDGALRHEYGHHIDNVLKYAAVYSPMPNVRLQQRRQAVIDMWGRVRRRRLGNNATRNDNELIAELWTLISHPEYPQWKQRQRQVEARANDADRNSVITIEALDVAESYFNLEGVPFFPVDDAPPDRTIDAVFVPRGIKRDRDGLPPKPGGVPIPDGMIRLYHITNNEDSLQSILTNGLDVSYARGETYGEPNMLWATAERPGDRQAYVEFWVTPEELDIGAPVAGQDVQASIDRIHEYGAHVTLRAGMLPPDRLVTYNDSYTSLLRELLEEGKRRPAFRQEVLDGFYDTVATDAPGYGAALERAKRRWASAAPTESPPPSRSIRRASVPNIESDRLLARLEYLSSIRNSSVGGRIPFAYRMAEKQAIERELVARNVLSRADLGRFALRYDDEQDPFGTGFPDRLTDFLLTGSGDAYIPVRTSWVRRESDPAEWTDLEWRGSAPRMPDEMIDWVTDDLVWPTDDEVRFYGHGITDPATHRSDAAYKGLVGNNGNGFMVDASLLKSLAGEIRASRQAGVPVNDELYVELWQAMTQSFNARVMLQKALENGVSSPQELEFYRLIHRHFNHQANLAGYGDAIPLERAGEQRGAFYPVSRRVPSRGRRVEDYQMSLVSFMRQRGLPRRDKLDADGNASSEPDPIDELPWFTETFGARQINRRLGNWGHSYPSGKLARQDILGVIGDSPFELVAGPPGMVSRFLRTGEPEVTREFDNPFFDSRGQRLALGDTVTYARKIRGQFHLQRTTGKIVGFPSIDRGPNRPSRKANLSIRVGDRIFAAAASDVTRVDPEPAAVGTEIQAVDALLIDGVRSPYRGMPNANLLEAEANPVIGLSDPDGVNGVSRVYTTVLESALAADSEFAAGYGRAAVLNDALRRQVRTGVPFDDAYRAVVNDETLVPDADTGPLIGSVGELLQGVLTDPNPDPALVGVFQRLHALYRNTVQDRPVTVQRIGGDAGPFAGPNSVTSWSNVAVTALSGTNPKWETTVPSANVLFPDGGPGQLLVASDVATLDRLMAGSSAAPFVRLGSPPARTLDAVRVDPDFDLGEMLAASPAPLLSYDDVPEPEVVAVRLSPLDVLADRLDGAVEAAAPLVAAGARTDVRVDRSGRELLDRGAFLSGLRDDGGPSMMPETSRRRRQETAEGIVRRTQDSLVQAVGPDGRVLLYRATPTVDDPFRPTDADAAGTTSWTTNPEWLGPYLRYAADDADVGVVVAAVPVQQILAWDDVGLMVGDGDGREVIVASDPQIVRRAVEGQRTALDSTQIDLVTVDPASGVPEWGERYVAAVRQATATDRIDRDDVADYRTSYQGSWKAEPEPIRNAALVAGGLAPPPDYISNYLGHWIPLSGATLYNDLVDSDTTADFPLFRGDLTAATRSVGEQFTDIRGFTGSAEIAQAFGGWQYRIDPGDTTLVATTDDLTQPDGWSFEQRESWVGWGGNELEVIAGGTFEVTAVDPANRVVTIRQVDRFPESPLARQVERVNDPIPAELDQPAVITRPSELAIRVAQLPPSAAEMVARSEEQRSNGGLRQRENTSVYPIDVLPIYRADDTNPVAAGTVPADSTATFEPVRAYRGVDGIGPLRRIPRATETVDVYRDLGQGRAHKRGYPDNNAFSVRMAGQTPVQASTIGVELTSPRVAWDAAAKAGSEADPNNQRSVHGFLRGEVSRYVTPVEAAVLVQQPGWQEVTYYPGTEDFFIPATRERVIGGDRAVASLGKFYLLNPRVVAGATAPRSVIEDRATDGVERRIGKRPSKGKAAQRAWDQLRSMIDTDPSVLSLDLLAAPSIGTPAASRGAPASVVVPLYGTLEPPLPDEVGASVRPAVSRSLVGDYPTLSRALVVDGIIRPDSGELRDDVRQMVSRTHDALRDAGVDRVVLYRGVPTSEAADPWGLIVDGTARLPGRRRPVGITSWTTDRVLAGMYAVTREEENGGVVVKAVVPRDQIISWDAIGLQRDLDDTMFGREVLVAATPDLLTDLLTEDEPVTVDALVASPAGVRVPDEQIRVYQTSEREPELPGEDAATSKPTVMVDGDSPIRAPSITSRTRFRDALIGSDTDTASVAAARNIVLGTQQALADAGIDSVVLYRGVPADEADDPFQFSPTDRIGANRRLPGLGESSGLTSWTTDRRLAAKYGKRVVKAIVPRELIVSWDSVGAKARPVGLDVDDGLPGNEVLVVRSSDIVERFFASAESPEATTIDLLQVATRPDYRTVVAERDLLVDDLIDAIRSGEFAPVPYSERQNAEFRSDLLAIIGTVGPVSATDRHRFWHEIVHHPVSSRPMVNSLITDPDPDPLLISVLRQARAEMQAELAGRVVEVNRRVWPGTEDDPFAPGSSPWFWRASQVVPDEYPDTGVTSWFLAPTLVPDTPSGETLSTDELVARQQQFMEGIAPLSEMVTLTVNPEQVLGRWGRAADIGEVLVARDATIGRRLDRGEFPLAGPVSQSIDLMMVDHVGWVDGVQASKSVAAPGTRSDRLTGQSTIHSVRLDDGRLVMVSTRMLSLPVEDRPTGLQDVRLIDGSASFVVYGPDGIRLPDDGLTASFSPLAGENGAAFVERAKSWALQAAQTPMVRGADPLPFDAGELDRLYDDSLGHQIVQMSWPRPTESFVASIQRLVQENPVAVRMGDEAFMEMLVEDPSPSIRNLYDPAISATDYQNEGYLSSRAAYDTAVGLWDGGAVHGYMAYTGTVTGDAFPSRMQVAQTVLTSDNDLASVNLAQLTSGDTPTEQTVLIDSSEANRYGPMEIVLKDRVKSRSYFTTADSLDSLAVPIPVVGDVPSDAAATQLLNPMSYVEVQVPGPIPLSEFAEVRVSADEDRLNELADALASRSFGGDVDFVVVVATPDGDVRYTLGEFIDAYGLGG